MNVVVVFHSVTGNGFILANAFSEAFKNRGDQVKLLRVADADIEIWQKKFAPAQEFAEAIMTIPTATAEDLCAADLIILGSPNYFGNVSAEFKTFLDSSAIYYLQQPLKGKKVGAFCTSSTFSGGGDFCLSAIGRFAQHCGMSVLSVPLALQMRSQMLTAYGVNHVVGAFGDIRPDATLLALIPELAEFWSGD